MSVWTYGPDVADALLEFVVNLVWFSPTYTRSEIPTSMICMSSVALRDSREYMLCYFHVNQIVTAKLYLIDVFPLLFRRLPMAVVSVSVWTCSCAISCRLLVVFRPFWIHTAELG